MKRAVLGHRCGYRYGFAYIRRIRSGGYGRECIRQLYGHRSSTSGAGENAVPIVGGGNCASLQGCSYEAGLA
ncbi:hypothetical protein D3C75_1095600 [compost metagenome]